MPARKFDVVFSGKLADGANPREVLKKICVLLELEDARIRELFKPGAAIRQDLDANAAYALREQFREIGVVCTVREKEPAPDMEASVTLRQPVTPQRPEQNRPRQDMKPRWQPPVTPQQTGPGIFSTVLKLIFVAAIAGGGWWAYQNWFAPPTPAFTAYAGFAEAIARGQYQKAADASQGDARAYAESLVQMTRPTSMKIYGRELNTTPPSVESIAGEISWIKRKRKSEVKKSAGIVALQVEQTVCRIPPGVSSALCKWPVTFQHDVELQLVDGGWKVSDFKEVRLTPQDK